MTNMLDLELVEETPVDEEDDHNICVDCFPGYQPGSLVTAVCGASTPDVPPSLDFIPEEATCTFCARMKYCPICGEEI